MGPYAGVVYNLTLCRLHESTIDSNTYTLGRQPHMPAQGIYPIYDISTLTICQNRLFPPVRDLELGLSRGRTLQEPKSTIWAYRSENSSRCYCSSNCRIIKIRNNKKAATGVGQWAETADKRRQNRRPKVILWMWLRVKQEQLARTRVIK